MQWFGVWVCVNVKRGMLPGFSLLWNRRFVIRDGVPARSGLRPYCGKGFGCRSLDCTNAHPRLRHRWRWRLIDRDPSRLAFHIQTRPRRDSQEMYYWTRTWMLFGDLEINERDSWPKDAWGLRSRAPGNYRRKKNRHR